MIAANQTKESMMLRPPLLSLCLLSLLSSSAFAQQAWAPVQSGTTSELRGLSVVSPSVAWASGAKGTVLRTSDGAQWQAISVPGAEKLDFRDIHAVDANIALVMSAGPGDASRILRTTDGGKTWREVALNSYKEGFWDSMAFWDASNGIVFGDPVDGKFQVYVTADGGATWREVKAAGLEAQKDEGAFAASGTALTVQGPRDVWIATGGAQTARVLRSSDRGLTWRASSLPIPAAAPGKGIFSVGFFNASNGMAVGGDYKQPLLEGINGARTSDGGATWQPVSVLPTGYMSVVVPVAGTTRSLVAGGLAGSGYSTDGGANWKALDRTPVNTVGFANPATGWAVGPKGLLMKYAGPDLNAAADIDAVVSKYMGPDFNGVVMVRNSKTSAPVTRAYGMAQFEKSQATQTTTPFQIGSITKWLSSVAVLRLVDQGKLALDVPIRAYLPEMPDHTASSVTLRHLLSNTAGIPNGFAQAFKQDPSVAALQLSHLQASLRFAAAAPMFPPGSKWDYSPTTWIVVGAIIERAAGMPYAQAIDKLVLQPAGTTSTAVPALPYEQIPGTGLAYAASQPRKVKMSPHVAFISASGTVYSTADDLLKLADTVYETNLLSAASRAELSRIIVRDQSYALGGKVRTLSLGGRPRQVEWKTGAIAGFKTLLAHVPGEGKTVVILNNTDIDQSAQGAAAEALLQAMPAGR
jgi:CubicO group peptidase (beta-lactamase class C family)